MAPPEVVSKKPLRVQTVETRTLRLSLKREYFEQIRDGQKLAEYRLCTPYWAKRLVERHYDKVVLTMGYPPAADSSRRIERPYKGYRLSTITHEHFRPEPVDVFEIDVTP